MSKLSLHEQLGVFIGRLLAKTDLTTQPTGTLRFGRVSVAKQRRRAGLDKKRKAYRRYILRQRTGLRPKAVFRAN